MFSCILQQGKIVVEIQYVYLRWTFVNSSTDIVEGVPFNISFEIRINKIVFGINL